MLKEEIIEDLEPQRQSTRRGLGFGNMLEASQKGTFEGDDDFKRQPETRIPCGFAAMLESAFPTKTRETLDENPRLVRRGMGFANMLEASQRGTE